MCVQCPRLSPPRPQTKQTEQRQICVLLLRLLSVVHRNDRDNIHKCTRPTTFVAIERCSVAHCSGVLLRVVRIGFVCISTAFSHPVVAQCTMRGDLKSRRTLLRTNNRKQQPPPENSSHTHTPSRFLDPPGGGLLFAYVRRSEAHSFLQHARPCVMCAITRREPQKNNVGVVKMRYNVWPCRGIVFCSTLVII